MPRVSLIVNMYRRDVNIDAARTLLSVLRDDLGLTGAKYGCGEGQCGACTVLVGGEPRRSCLMKAVEAAGKPVVTIEGLAEEGRLHPLQQAFLDHDALQCGYCTPGMILAAVALLNRNPKPTDQEILRHLEGHICRCGTYPRILAAVRSVRRA